MLDIGETASHALRTLVEASRSVPREDRQPFLALSSGMSFNLHLSHPGLRGRQFELYPGDLDTLVECGLVRRKPLGGQGMYELEITQAGNRAYERVAAQIGKPIQQIETHVTSFIEARGFEQRHPEAYTKVREALEHLWSGEEDVKVTLVGHLCREATQAFANSLLRATPTVQAPRDEQLTQARVQAVLQHLAQLSSAEESFLKALLAYWAALTDLVQRQEHGATKEGQELTWEDARRVAFQTFLVMYEIDRVVGKYA